MSDATRMTTAHAPGSAQFGVAGASTESVAVVSARKPSRYVATPRTLTVAAAACARVPNRQPAQSAADKATAAITTGNADAGP